MGNNESLEIIRVFSTAFIERPASRGQGLG